MNVQDDILDISKFNLQGNFESQVDYLLATVRLTRPEVQNLQCLIDDVEKTFNQPWPGCRVHPFGSIITGLGIRSSDVDCYVSLPRWVKIENKLVYKAKAYLQGQPFLFSELLAIPMAKVPIVKFCHIPTGRHCDVNFSSMAGVQNSKLLANLLHRDPRALRLAILVKYWSKVHNLTGTNLVPNYALTLLLIFYLQHLDILPSVHLLQQTVTEFMVHNWNTAFDGNSTSHYGDNSLTLYQLLGGFFDFYSSFDFEHQVVSTYLGRPILKENFKRIDSIPQEYELYKHNLSNKICQELRLNTSMCVQDPFEHCRNCSVAVHQKLFNIIMKYIKNSAQMFYVKESERYLRSILTKVQCKADEIEIRNSQNRVLKRQPNKVMKQKQKNNFAPPRITKKNMTLMYEEIRKNKRS